MKLTVQSARGDFVSSMKGISGDIADASRMAVRQAVELAQRRSKADVAASGLGPRWVGSIKSRFYPNNGLDAAGIIYSSIPFSVVFEQGAEIKGNPKLWIPLPTTPPKIGGKRITPKLYAQQGGRLFKVNIRGKDYLAARIATAKGAVGSVQPRSLSMLKRKRGKGQVYSLVPLFVAASSVTLRKRLHIGAITEAAADRLPDLFAAAIKED